MVGNGGSSAGLYLADPTSPILSHCAVIILFKGVPVHQLLWLALQELIQQSDKKWGETDQGDQDLAPKLWPGCLNLKLFQHWPC